MCRSLKLGKENSINAGKLMLQIDRFGRFKVWHGGGSLLVAVSFSCVFGTCLVCTILGTNSITVRTIGYSIFAAIFNIGWATTQVSHMAMVNCVTANSTSRVALSAVVIMLLPWLQTFYFL